MTPRSLVLAAWQRHEAAGILHVHGAFLDAVYLGGYAGEFAMKSVILSRTRPSRRSDLLQNELFRTAAGHNLDRLVGHLATQLGESVPRRISEAVRNIRGIWRVDLRYTTGRGSQAESKRLLTVTRSLVEWAEEVQS